MAEDFRNQHIDFQNERYQTVRAVSRAGIQSRHDHPTYLAHTYLTLRCLRLLQVRELGRGNFGVTMLMQDLQTSEYVAAKFIQRGAKVRGLCSTTATCIVHCSVSCRNGVCRSM